MIPAKCQRYSAAQVYRAVLSAGAMEKMKKATGKKHNLSLACSAKNRLGHLRILASSSVKTLTNKCRPFFPGITETDVILAMAEYQAKKAIRSSCAANQKKRLVPPSRLTPLSERVYRKFLQRVWDRRYGYLFIRFHPPVTRAHYTSKVKHVVFHARKSRPDHKWMTPVASVENGKISFFLLTKSYWEDRVYRTVLFRIPDKTENNSTDPQLVDIFESYSTKKWRRLYE